MFSRHRILRDGRCYLDTILDVMAAGGTHNPNIPEWLRTSSSSLSSLTRWRHIKKELLENKNRKRTQNDFSAMVFSGKSAQFCKMNLNMVIFLKQQDKNIGPVRYVGLCEWCSFQICTDSVQAWLWVLESNTKGPKPSVLSSSIICEGAKSTDCPPGLLTSDGDGPVKKAIKALWA